MRILDLMDECKRRFDGADDGALLARVCEIERDPDDPHPVHRLAELCRQHGYADLWPVVAHAALALLHVTHQQLFHRAQTKLTLGDWSGWTDRESRLFNPTEYLWRSAFWRRIRWTTPAWDGIEDLRDQSIFVIADGGFGDCIQMLRFVPILAKMAREVILGVRPELVSFARHNFTDRVTVTCRELDHAPPSQCYTWLMSLAALCGELPPFEPLAAPNPIPRSNLDPRRLQIGVCWAGSHYDPHDRRRFLPLDALAPLFDHGDMQWHSLQVGAWAPDAAGYPSLRPPAIPLTTFADTANFIASLDCVVGVCSSVAHFAGCLGVPTFLMLRCGADWRWELGDTTPWYPSMRLIRQPSPGNWASAVDELANCLKSLQSALIH